MGLQVKWVSEELTPEQKIKKLQRKLAFAFLFILFLILGFIVYELKFAEKSIFDKGDKYEEYDPNYITDDNSNIEQAAKKKTSNVIEGITSNITVTSNVINNDKNTSNVVSNVTSNIVSNNNSIVNSNKISNATSNTTSNTTPSKDTTKPTISRITVNPSQYIITVTNVECSDNITSSSNLKKEYSIDGKLWSTNNNINNLYPGTSYTVYVRVTDEAGNVSNTYSTKASTAHLSAPGDVSGNYSNQYIVYQHNNIVYAVNDSEIYSGSLTSSGTYSKTFKLTQPGTSFYITPTFQDNSILTGGKTYRKTSSVTATEMFKAMFGGDFVTSSTSEFQGYYTSEYGYLYIIAYKVGTTVKYKIYAYSNDLKKGEWVDGGNYAFKGSYYQMQVYDSSNTIIAYFITTGKDTSKFHIADNYKNGEAKYPALYDVAIMGVNKSYAIDKNQAINLRGTK